MIPIGKQIGGIEVLRMSGTKTRIKTYKRTGKALQQKINCYVVKCLRCQFQRVIDEDSIRRRDKNHVIGCQHCCKKPARIPVGDSRFDNPKDRELYQLFMRTFK